ncbi:MAG: mannosyl-3-phosphoglycerate phosphatase, partial [Opitutales bacterium]
MAKTAWLICTDLDASLLDAEYQWTGAEVALSAVRALGVPLVLNSSKTFAEMAPFAAALDPLAPVISENGTAIGYPQCWGLGAADVAVDSYSVEYCGMPRKELLRIAHDLRERKGYRFRGFSEMEAEALTEMLGLDAKQARAALKRH